MDYCIRRRHTNRRIVQRKGRRRHRWRDCWRRYVCLDRERKKRWRVSVNVVVYPTVYTSQPLILSSTSTNPTGVLCIPNRWASGWWGRKTKVLRSTA
jgi:hypothetical protein